MRSLIIPKIGLENEFIGKGEVKGFRFRKIASTQHANLYEVDSGVSNVHYEVFMRKLVPVCIDFENRLYSKTEQKEVYPKSKDFGVWAWTYNNILKAEQKYLEL